MKTLEHLIQDQEDNLEIEIAQSPPLPSMDLDMPLHLLVEIETFQTSRHMPTEILIRHRTLPTIGEVQRKLTFKTSDYHMITWQ